MALTIDQHAEVEFGLQCVLCKHRDLGYGVGCAAFPNGIPLAIMRDEFDHSLPFPGDQGIQFEPMDPSSFERVHQESLAGVI